MPDEPIQILRRLTGAAGPPTSLEPGQLAFNANGSTLYIGTDVPTSPVTLVSTSQLMPSGGSANQLLMRNAAGNAVWEPTGSTLNIGTNTNAGTESIAIGNNALRDNTGNQNVAIGTNAMQNTGSMSVSVAMGAFAMVGGVGGAAGQNNIAIGRMALWGLAGATNVGNNVAIGMGAGSHIRGGVIPMTQSQTSIFIGSNVRPDANDQANQIVIGHHSTGHGSNTITLGDQATTQALYTRAGLVIGDLPATFGGPMGVGTINAANGIFIQGVPVGFSQSIAWTSETNPSGCCFYINTSGRDMTIIRIVGRVEVREGAAASLTVRLSSNLQNLNAGPALGAAFDLNPGTITNQVIVDEVSNPTGILFPNGSRLGLVSADVIQASVASVSVYMRY